MEGVCIFNCQLVFLRPFGILYGRLVYFTYGYLVYFSSFGMLYQEKSGNPAPKHMYTLSHLAKQQETICKASRLITNEVTVTMPR
jgi:hypothetical protein